MTKLYIFSHQQNLKNKNIIIWNDKCAQSKNVKDIFSLIDKNKLIIRKKYLEWISKIKNYKINKVNLFEILKIDNKFSYWWMHPISEKSNFLKSFHINEIIKIIALEEFLKNKKITKIITNGLSYETNKAILLISKKKKIRFSKINYLEKSNLTFPVINFFKSILWIPVYLYKKRFLFKYGLSNWENSKNNLTIVNYLFDIDHLLLRKKIFKSGYWGDLINTIKKKNIGINWLHIYFEYEEIPSSKEAKKIIKQLIKTNNKDIHITLDSFFSFKILLKSLKVWSKIFYQSLFIGRNELLNKKNNIYFSLLEKEFYDNLQNHHLLKNILTYFLMKEAFSKISLQSTCIFPNENQPWEMALIKNYSSNSHKNIIGYQHSTIRFWDLRTYYDKKQYIDNSALGYPKPNLLAIHSKLFINTILKSDYPKQNLKLVETLKYKKLAEKRKYNKKIYPRFNKEKINITLVLGAFRNFDLSLIKCLERNLSNFNNNFSFYVKDQLSSDEVLQINENPKFKKVNGNLIDIFNSSNLVIISNPSSAVLDAMYMNTPFLVYDGGNFLNFSPMYNVINQEFFVRDYNFVSKIKFYSIKENKNFWKFDKNKILEINKDIKNWKKLINFN